MRDSADERTAGMTGSGGPFELHYRRVEGIAVGHDRSARLISGWADADADFADRFLATHGKVAYATYRKVKAYNDSRREHATAYADRNAATARSLRDFSALISATDDSAGRAFGAADDTDS